MRFKISNYKPGVRLMIKYYFILDGDYSDYYLFIIEKKIIRITKGDHEI